jgi:hypothetical protein
MGKPSFVFQRVIRPSSSVTLWAAKNSGGTRFFVASQVTALAPFSQNWKAVLCFLSGQAQPGQSNPVGWLVRSSVREASSACIWVAIALAVARNAPQPPAGLS